MKNLNMKRLIVLVMLLTAGIVPALACEIEFEVAEKSAKEVYQTGDEIIVTVTVILTHRNCHVGIQDTDFDGDGLKIKQATKWQEVKPGMWERKLKVEVIGNKTGELSLSASRTCNKEGGYGIIELKGA